MFKQLFQSDLIRKFFKFGLVGVANTGVDFVVYIGLTRLIPFFFVHYLIANSISFVTANINSFYLNKYWTFREKKGKVRTQYPKFFAFQIVGFGFSVLIINFAIEYLYVHDIIAKAFASISVMIWNFLLSKYIVFKVDSPLNTQEEPNISKQV